MPTFKHESTSYCAQPHSMLHDFRNIMDCEQLIRQEVFYNTNEDNDKVKETLPWTSTTEPKVNNTMATVTIKTEIIDAILHEDNATIKLEPMEQLNDRQEFENTGVENNPQKSPSSELHEIDLINDYEFCNLQPSYSKSKQISKGTSGTAGKSDDFTRKTLERQIKNKSDRIQNNNMTRYAAENLNQITNTNLNDAFTVSVKLIQKDKRCIYSHLQNLYHIKSGKDSNVHMKITINKSKNLEKQHYQPEDVNFRLFINIQLRRTNKYYKNMLVDKICDKHIEETKFKYPIIGAVCEEHTVGNKKCISINERKEKLQIILNKNFVQYHLEHGINICMKLGFACNDSCVTSTKLNKLKEKARDLAIFTEIGMIYNKPNKSITVCSPSPIPVWIKAMINKRDLAKEQRRKEKGFIALQNKRAENTITPEELRKILTENEHSMIDTEKCANELAGIIKKQVPNPKVQREILDILEKYKASEQINVFS